MSWLVFERNIPHSCVCYFKNTMYSCYFKRLCILSWHVMPLSVSCLQAGLASEMLYSELLCFVYVLLCYVLCMYNYVFWSHFMNTLKIFKMWINQLYCFMVFGYFYHTYKFTGWKKTVKECKYFCYNTKKQNKE